MKTRALRGSTWMLCLLAGALSGVVRPGGPASEAPARPVQYVVGLSPFLSDAARTRSIVGFVRFVLEDMPSTRPPAV